MQSELKSLSKIFSETLLRIPDYQRGYAWGLRQLKDFWNDLEQLPDGKSHYTGVLTLQKADDYSKWIDDIWIISSKKYNPLYVVDGQQRLTTAIILIQAILDCVDDKTKLNYTTKEEIQKKYIFESKDEGISRSYIFGYEKDNPSDEFLKTHIFGAPSDNHVVLEDTIYTRNLFQAKKYLSERVSILNHKQLEDLFTNITQNLLFNIFYIEPQLDVFVTFETINHRGKLLSHLELLKNRLIYLSTKFNIEESEREKLRRAINENWKSVYHSLGKIQSKQFDDDKFLSSHFFCYFGSSPLKYNDKNGREKIYNWRYHFHDDIFYKEYLLEEYFTTKRTDNKKNKLTHNDIYHYAKSIRNIAENFQIVANPNKENTTIEESTLLNQLNRLSNNKIFQLTIVVQYKIKNKNKRIMVLRELERLGFVIMFHPDVYYTWQADELVSKLLGDSISPEELKEELSNTILKTIDSSEFLEAIRKIGKSGYYHWGRIRYFMYEYEQHLRLKSKTSRHLLDWQEDDEREDYDYDHKSVEHIYPQKADNTYWKERFNCFSVQQRNILKNSLGNLLPVSQPKNASLSNRSFPEKLGDAERQVGYKYGCLSEIQVSMEPDWTPLAILRRGIYLLEFMEKRWSLELGTAEKKIELLGLQFVAETYKLKPDDILAYKLHIPKLPDSLQT
ncbi:MAG: DUF262 domain-containing HNH endonuclease family protein [Candidatus Sumerlaeia bacterium]|nr:DUF262 domain-containing HNH endonuclease family protein [Candidatus Sumerlaeia bacterium]